jgi:hypothetical protein
MLPHYVRRDLYPPCRAYFTPWPVIIEENLEAAGKKGQGSRASIALAEKPKRPILLTDRELARGSCLASRVRPAWARCLWGEDRGSKPSKPIDLPVSAGTEAGSCDAEMLAPLRRFK